MHAAPHDDRESDPARRPPSIRQLTADERWRLVDRLAQEGIWIIDARNRTTYVNQVVADMLGHPVEDILGAGPFEFMDEESRQIAEDRMERRRQGTDVEDLDFRYRHRDGRDVWVSLHATQLLGADGENLGVLATLLDVSALRTAERDLPLVQQIAGLPTADDFGAALQQVLRGIAEGDSRWDLAQVWAPHEGHGAMVCRATWSRASGAAGADRASLPAHLSGADCAERARMSGVSDWVENCTEVGDGGIRNEDGEQSILVVPARGARDVTAVVVLFASRGYPRDEHQMERVELLARQLGLAFERKQSDDQRVAADRRLHEFIDHMPALVSMRSLDGRVLLQNRSVAGLNSRLDRSETAGQVARTNDALVAHSGVPQTFEEMVVLPDGVRWYSSVRFPVLDSSDEVYAVGAISSDITDRKKLDEELSEAYRQLERRALRDSLTGLPNRAQLVERLAQLDSSRVAATALVFVDLDDFKDVNDTYGHAEGDDVLRMAAARMRRCTRPGDVLARLGGDEFAVLLEGHDARVAEDLAQRIIQAMDAPFVVAGQATRVTASVGVAIGTSTDTDGFELLRFADMAMYEAKLRGKGRFAVFDAALGEAHVLRTRGGQELRQGIERDELVLHYQPIVDLTSGDVVGLEALVRWQHPSRGLLQPDEFVALAERTGAIDALGRWVLLTACEQHSAWRATRTADRPLQMSVNVSTHQLDDPTFALTVAEVLASTDLEPSSLCLDITESAVLADPVQAQKTVEDLRQLGVELAIDDFGTGYASLTTLRRLHASGVKIDRTFIGSLGDDEEDLHIVAAVIGLARAMGLSVTAEGVETPEQLALLRDLGCQQAQGFHLGRPVPADELSDQLRHRWVDLRS